MKINSWYIENVLTRNEGLKYFPEEYKVTILEINAETGYYGVKIEFDNIIIFYDIPPSQIINEEENDEKDTF